MSSPGRVVAQLEKQQHPAQGDGDGGKEDVEGDIGGELDSRQHQSVHQTSPVRFLPPVTSLSLSRIS